MSWQVIEKIKNGGDQYNFVKYSTSLGNSSTVVFESKGFSKGTISFTSSGSTTVTIEHSINNEDFYIIKIKENPQTNDFLSINLPIAFLRITNSNNTINNIHMLLKS